MIAYQQVKDLKIIIWNSIKINATYWYLGYKHGIVLPRIVDEIVWENSNKNS